MVKEIVAEESKLHLLVSAIKAKKGLESLDETFVKQKVEKVFGGNAKIQKKFESSRSFAQFSRSKEYDELLKQVRKELRVIYGVFQKESRDDLLAALKNTGRREAALNQILQSHQSSAERLPHYDEIYSVICEKLDPHSVIDLGCGMNPLAWQWFVKHGCSPHILASDVSERDMMFLRSAFEILKIPGEALAIDLTTDYGTLASLHADVTFLFKLLDSLEESKRHISYKIFENITTPWIVVSFPTKSIGGKKNIARAGRTWFERLLKRKEYTWETFSVANELFYIIRTKVIASSNNPA